MKLLKLIILTALLLLWYLLILSSTYWLTPLAKTNLDIIRIECETQCNYWSWRDANKCIRDAYWVATAESSFFKNASKFNAFGLVKKWKKIVYTSYEENIKDWVRRWTIYRYKIEGRQWITKAHYNNGKGTWYTNFTKWLAVYDQISR